MRGAFGAMAGSTGAIGATLPASGRFVGTESLEPSTAAGRGAAWFESPAAGGGLCCAGLGSAVGELGGAAGGFCSAGSEFCAWICSSEAVHRNSSAEQERKNAPNRMRLPQPSIEHPGAGLGLLYRPSVGKWAGPRQGIRHRMGVDAGWRTGEKFSERLHSRLLLAIDLEQVHQPR